MRNLAFALLLLGAAAPVARAERAITGSAEQVTHDCGADPVVVVSGSSNQLTITGACTSISVQGSANRLTVAAVTAVMIQGSTNQLALDQVDKIRVQGVGNRVDYKRPLAAKKVKVSRQGLNNRIRKVK